MEWRAFQTAEPPYRRAQRASLLALVGFVGLCLLAWAASGAGSAGGGRGWFGGLARPPLSPPDWAFGPARLSPVWMVTDLCLALAAWLVWRKIDVAAHRKRAALRLWGWLLLASAACPGMLFSLHSPRLGFGAVLVLLAAAMATAIAFWRLQRRAAMAVLPCLAWAAYETYLTFGLLWLNPT